MTKQVNRRTFLKVSGTVLGGIAVGSQVTAATRTDRFIVETRGGRLPTGVDVIHELSGLDVAVVRASEGALEASKTVEAFAPDVEIRLDAPDPNEAVPPFDASDYEGQPGDFLQWDKSDLDVPTAHETTEGEGTRVAIIDTGILETHPDLAGPLNLDLSRNFTADGGDHNPVGAADHGTHVGGIVAADNGGGIGVNGTAPKTDLVDCRVFSGESALFADILAAIHYSASIDADVANLSLGAYPVPRQALGSFYGKVLNTAMTDATRRGTLLAVAAGNDTADLQHDKNFISLPNEGARAVSVAATGPIGYGWGDEGVEAPPESPAFYTNYGTNAISLGAPGGDADLSAAETDVPWYRDLVFNAAFAHNGSLVWGTFGPEAATYPGSVSATWSGDRDGNVSVSGDPPFTTDGVPWYASVGFGGVRFEIAEGPVFTGDETVTVDYATGPGHERLAPDWIALQVEVPPADPESEDASPTPYVVIDWRVSESSGTTVSWNANDSFGDGHGGVFQASSVEDIFAVDEIDPSSPNASPSDVIGEGTVQSVGVFSGGGVGRDEAVDITYEGVGFEGAPLLVPQTPIWGWKAGTSMASPNVAGAAALVKSANPNYNANQVANALERAAEVPEGYGKEFYGSGYLNILDAL